MTLTFERATVYEGTQWGLETTPGVRVPAIKRLLGTSFELDHMTDRKPYKPQGNKFTTTSQTGKEWTQGKLSGILCFNDMLYLASGWLTKTTPTVPANNSTFTVTATTTNTVGFTYKGAVLAPAAYTTAALFEAAIAALTTVGVGNVSVTGTPSGGWVIKFKGALSTDTSVPGSVTGTASATIAAQNTGTLTNRWVFLMAPSGPDDVQTFSMEKGAAGVANMGQAAAFGFPTGMSFKHSKSEATFTGEMAAQITTDPFTLTTASLVDVPCVSVDPAATGVWIGTSLVAPSKMTRILDYEFGVTNRASGLMTLNDDDTSFSNRIENDPQLTTKFFQEHIGEGQTMLARLRNGTNIITYIESQGPQIEAGFNYRMKWTLSQTLLKPNTGDVDGAYGNNYDCELCYNSALGSAIRLEIDSPLSAL